MRKTRSATASRGGFTLLEVIVVIAIVGILMGMLLPAIQMARESARRMQCQQNLVRVILAATSYHESQGVYPAGTTAQQGPVESLPQGDHWSWVIPLLPYLDYQNAYDSLDRSVSIYAPENQPVRSLGLSVLSCPTSSNRVAGYSAYAGLQHDVEAPIDADNHGIFFLNSYLPKEEVTDGVSQTFFFGEKLTFVGDLGWASGTRATLRNTGSRLNAVRQQANTGNWQHPELPPGLSNESREPSAGGPEWDPLLVGGFASDHPGGANFARGDGSVGLVGDSIGTEVYQQLGHRHDGALLTDY